MVMYMWTEYNTFKFDFKPTALTHTGVIMAKLNHLTMKSDEP